MNFKTLITSIFLCLNFISPFIAQADEFTIAQADELAAPSDELNSQNQLLSSTRKTSWTADVVRVPTDKNGIPGLKIIDTHLPVFLVKKEKKYRPLVALELSLDDPVAQLYGADYRPLPKNKNTGYFMFFAYLNSKKNEVVFYSKSNKEKSEKEKSNQEQKYVEKMFIISDQAQEFNVISPWESLRVSLGSSYFNYSQTSYASFNAWTGLLAMRLFSEDVFLQWGYNAEADLTVLTVTSNQNEVSMQTGHIKAEALYSLPQSPNTEFKYSILGGVNYLTTFTTGSAMGFKNLIVPSAGLRSRKILNEKEDYGFTVRAGLFGFDFKDRGLDFEISRSYLFEHLHRAELGLKFSDYGYHPQHDDQFVNLKMLSVFLSYTL